jgi:hypothetical protein
MRARWPILAALLALLALPAVGQEQGRSIQVIVDNSGALQNAGVAEPLKKQLLFHVTELRKSREFKTARVHVISTNNPRNLFVGTPVDFFRNGAGLLSSIATVQNGCADLVGALEQAKLNVELDRPSEIDVYVFSSLIHTGSPCDKVTIELPQQAPKDLDFRWLTAENIRVRFYFVHHLQVKSWLEALRAAGLSAAAIYDEETTRTVLQKGLGP